MCGPGVEVAAPISKINAGAVEEQLATTNRLSRLFDGARHDADATSHPIGLVASSAVQTAGRVTSTRGRLGPISPTSGSRNDVVSGFRIAA
jgi:hypothetical protein